MFWLAARPAKVLCLLRALSRKLINSSAQGLRRLPRAAREQ
jgi:hypothetical protein